jgi:transcription antitermination factor NusG
MVIVSALPVSPVVPDAAALPEWYAVYVMPRHEKRIAEHFHARQIEHFLPLYEARHKWKDGSKVTLQLPLFPGYVFVRTARNRRTRALEVPGVLSVVGTRDASRIQDAYIHSLREGLRLGKVEPHPYLVAGAVVRVKSGVMAGMQGVLLRRKGGCRIVLTLDLIMKSVAVEVDMDDLEPVSGESKSQAVH